MKYLITGGTGSWGNELTKQLLLKADTELIIIYSRGEAAQVTMKRKFNDNRLKIVIGDVRDFDALCFACRGIQTVIHLAALKHVPICEEMPLEAIKTNITGTENVIRASVLNGVLNVIDVSTDKACSPNNLYGMTKAVGEKLILNANGQSETKFTCIRAGNVLGSAGSVVPLFIDQIRRDNCLMVTDKSMTRYFMSLPEAISLILVAMQFDNADMFVMKMPSCTIGDLAFVIAKKYGDTFTTMIETGTRPGEKLHELLINESEALNTYDYDRYFMISNYSHVYPKVKFKEYGSNTQKLMTHSEILDMLKKGGY